MSRMERLENYGKILKAMWHDYNEMLCFNTKEEISALYKENKETLEYGRKHGWD